MIVSLISSSAHSAGMEGQWLYPFNDLSLLNRLGSQVMTGSYHNYFRIYDVEGSSDVILQADKSAFKTPKKVGLL
jgi:hypothetical protein